MNQVGQLLLYDRLWHNSGLSPTTAGAQTVNSVALTRPDALGTGAEAWFQVYTALGAGSTAGTITYTNPAGTGSKTGTMVNFVTTAAAARCFPFSLAAGDTGVKSIQSFTIGATMSSGTYGLIIRRYVAGLFSPISNVGSGVDPIAAGLARIYDSACLELVWLAASTSSHTLGGNVGLAQG